MKQGFYTVRGGSPAPTVAYKIGVLYTDLHFAVDPNALGNGPALRDNTVCYGHRMPACVRRIS